MSFYCWVSKGDLITMLGKDAITFCEFLLSDDPLAKIINKMFEITANSGVELDEPIVQSLLYQLHEKGVISDTTKTNIENWIAEKLAQANPQTPPPQQEEQTQDEPEEETPPNEEPQVIYTLKKYRVYYTAGIENINSWINQNRVPEDAPYDINTLSDCYEILIKGELPLPAEALYPTWFR